MSQAEFDSNPTTIVIFGASGNLTQRKLVPALFNLYRKDRLPAATRIVGFANTPLSTEEFRTHLRLGIEKHTAPIFDATAWAEFSIFDLPMV